MYVQCTYFDNDRILISTYNRPYTEHWPDGSWIIVSGLISDMVGLFVIQGCDRISLRLILSWGRILRHWRIRSWTPDDEVRLNSTLATQICSSFSKGISPWTISKRRIPRDQTVAGLPRYLEQVIHSGGAYTRVPKQKLY